MVEQQATPLRSHNPLWNDGTTKRCGSRWTRMAIAASIAAHVGLVAYIYETKIVVEYKTHQGDPTRWGGCLRRRGRR